MRLLTQLAIGAVLPLCCVLAVRSAAPGWAQVQSLLAPSALAADDSSGGAPPDNPGDGKEAEQAPPDSAAPSEGTDVQAPEGVRRRRPDTAEEERKYKLRKTREDPFLNPPPVSGPTPDKELHYNPRAHLQVLGVGDVTRYIVQDLSGKVVGYLTLSVELFTDQAKNDYVLFTKLSDAPPRTETKLLLRAQGLTSERVERTFLRAQDSGNEGTGGPTPAKPEAGDIPLEQQPPRIVADYLFDRVTITMSQGPAAVIRQIRQLPYSFDLDALPLLMRALDCQHMAWPFEAALTDPANLESLPLAIAGAERLDVLSAEPRSYRCFELKLKIGSNQQLYYIQRTAPFRLVKFNDGQYIYTLFEYVGRP